MVAKHWIETILTKDLGHQARTTEFHITRPCFVDLAFFLIWIGLELILPILYYWTRQVVLITFIIQYQSPLLAKIFVLKIFHLGRVIFSRKVLTKIHLSVTVQQWRISDINYPCCIISIVFTIPFSCDLSTRSCFNRSVLLTVIRLVVKPRMDIITKIPVSVGKSSELIVFQFNWCLSIYL